MNLQEFLSHKKDCPFCNQTLGFCFHSQKQQTNRYEEERLIILFRLNGLKKHQIDYKAGYSFGLLDNSWRAEFYTQDDKRFENDSPNFLRDRFKELDKNLKQSYRFYKHCKRCARYNYSSNSFSLDYKSGNIGDLMIKNEFYGIVHPLQDGYRLFKLNVNYDQNTTDIFFGKEKDDVWAREDSSISSWRHIRLSKPLNTESLDVINDKLKTIMVFS